MIPPLLDELLRAPGPSGREDAVAAIVRREAEAFGAAVEGDVLGSTVARVAGTDGGGRLLALFAHVDQIGVSVTHVTDDGLLRVRPLATWSPRDAVGHRLRVLGRDGPVTAVARRVGEGDDPSWDDVRLDIGAATRDEALALVAPGDPAVLVGESAAVAGNRVLSAALDDRVGVYAALEALRRLAAEPPGWDVALVASTQEESGHGGAAAASGRLRPDAALVVDVTYEDHPLSSRDAWGEVALGGGPVLFRGPVVSPLLVERLAAAAAAAGVAHRVEAGKQTDSDADDVFVAAGGIATGLVSIPLRYMHTASEMAQLDDVAAATDVIEAFARGLEPDASFVR